LGTTVLAIGAELKNTFCVGTGDLQYLSPYVGDLTDVRTVEALSETVERMLHLLEATPQVVACDLHPAYNSTVVAQALADRLGCELVGVQHHFAHVASCMVENDHEGTVVGVSFDGTGYGTDGTIWGGEILVCDTRDFTRAATIANIPMGPQPVTSTRLPSSEPARLAACSVTAKGSAKAAS
jgi:hydrogenase maturation protein HypF